MRVNAHCAACLWDKQQKRSQHPGYLEEARKIIENRREDDTAPYLVYLFNQAYARYFGKLDSYRDIKRTYNDFVLTREQKIREKILSAPDPLAASIGYARVGNYIDFGAMNHVNADVLLEMLENVKLNEQDLKTYHSFAKQCENAKRFLLVADNCGEIVLDKLFLEQLSLRYPQLSMTVMVRESEVLNDATREDALYCGIDRWADIVNNGSSVAGVVLGMLTERSRKAIQQADVILSKGQGNYESLCGQGLHIFYSLLCKCELFTERFQAPMLTGIFIEE